MACTRIICADEATKYSCRSDVCVLDPNGTYTDDACGGECAAPIKEPDNTVLYAAGIAALIWFLGGKE